MTMRIVPRAIPMLQVGRLNAGHDFVFVHGSKLAATNKGTAGSLKDLDRRSQDLEKIRKRDNFFAVLNHSCWQKEGGGVVSSRTSSRVCHARALVDRLQPREA